MGKEEKNLKGEKAEEMNQKGEEKREKNYAGRHHEIVEKNVNLAKQRIERWMKKDSKLEAKVLKMQMWNKKQKAAALKAAEDEAGAKKLVDSLDGAFERSDKKRQEAVEKEKMNNQFKEMLRKDDEKEKQEALKKLEEEKERYQKDQDRVARAEEKKDKKNELKRKADLKEKEGAEKSSELKTKAKNLSATGEKSTKAEVAAKKHYEAGEKKELTLAAKLAEAKKYHKIAGDAAKDKTLTGAKKVMAVVKAKKSVAELKVAHAKEKEFKAGLDAEKSKLKEMKRKKKEHDDHRKKIKAKYESKMKKEKGQKDEVKKAQEQKGKASIKAFADKKKATAAKAKAKEEARKMKRTAEKTSKDVQAGRDKQEREEKQVAKEKKTMKERVGKKGDAQIAAIKAKTKKKKTAREAKIAAQTLREQLAKRKKWKITLAERRKQEKDDREKEMKTVPHKILTAEANKYRKLTSAALKKMNQDKKAYAGSYGRWNAQERKVKGLTAKERMLKGEKKSLFKALANAVRTEYRTGKKLKKQRKQMDAEDKLTMKEEKKEGKKAAKQVKKLDEAEAKTDDDKQQAEMQVDVSRGKKKKAAKQEVKKDNAKEKNLEEEKKAVSKEAAAKKKKLDKSKKKAEKVKQKAKNKSNELKDKISNLRNYVKNEKAKKKQDEATMKDEAKQATKTVKSLRHKEMKTKHAEIAERAKTQGLDGSVEELKVVRNKDKVKYDAKKEVYDKANVKLGLAKKVLVSVKDHHEAVKSKEAGIKQSIAKGKADLKKMVGGDKTIRDNEKRAEQTNQKAKSQRDAAIDAYKKAFADEKNSKNDALERTKKQEASAITRAVEKKNKASEAEAKAYEKRAELRRKQFNRAKVHHTAIIKSMDKFIAAKQVLSKKHRIADLSAVKAMETSNDDRVNAAENAEKQAVKEVEESQDQSDSSATKAQERRVKLDKSNARLKKAEDILAARSRSQEAAKKARTIAKKEADRKTTQKNLLRAHDDLRKAAQKEKEAKFKVKGASAEAEKAGNVEKMSRHLATKASAAKLTAVQNQERAKQAQESSAKVADRFRTLATMISERKQKRKTSTVAVHRDEKTAKFAEDEAKLANDNCQKAKDQDANVGVEYVKLKEEMKEWTRKNPWLKQKEVEQSAKKDVNVGESVDESQYDVGESDTSGDLDMEESLDAGEDPEWAKMSFIQLVKEHTGTDVVEGLKRHILA